MNGLFHLFAQDDTYGPGTDLAMALLGIFVLSLVITKKNEAVASSRLKDISDRQMAMIRSIAQNYHTEPELVVHDGDSLFLIATTPDKEKVITVRNGEVTQLYTFGESLLFRTGKEYLQPEGITVMEEVGRVIKGQSRMLEEIQIQGHADTTPPGRFDKYGSNIELASARATTVFNLFKDQSGINPSDILMSIVSYGEFKPVQRRTGAVKWSQQALDSANDIKEKRDQNRRIEIVLIFR